MMPWEQFFTLVVQLLILLGIGFVVAAVIVGVLRGTRGGK